MEFTGNKLSLLDRKQLPFEEGMVFEVIIICLITKAGTTNIRITTKNGGWQGKQVWSTLGSYATRTLRIDGIPIMIAITDALKTWKQGECFAKVQLKMNGVIITELCTGNVYAGKGISYPQQNSQEMRLNGGTETLEGPDSSGLGSELDNFSWASNFRGKILAWRAKLTTSAVAGNRHPVFCLGDSHGKITRCWNNQVQTASQTKIYYLGQFGDIRSEIDNNAVLINMNQEWLLPESAPHLWTETLGLLGGDRWTESYVLMEKFQHL
jgi:hypothetical protein